ncbi:hypothetical protein [Nocardia macrotermitis]|uniref:Uncharacterized protein n=1 Tax=Nocardia macrotermitis TaxID=2585198 RepID=A0A7K0DA05_9NOCA|nr:hypothetical protein [Nocardia macrotermitis]MQY21714.1 hypothetical protein [Nocardia macrotermitis]
MIAYISTHEITQPAELDGQIVGGLHHLRNLLWRTYAPDDAAIAEHGSAPAAIAAHLRQLEEFIASTSEHGPVPDTVPADQWLFAYRPIEGHTAIHTRVYLAGCTDTERAGVFKAVTE